MFILKVNNFYVECFTVFFYYYYFIRHLTVLVIVQTLIPEQLCVVFTNCISAVEMSAGTKHRKG